MHSESSLGWGGQECRVLSELTGFRARGCKVSLIAPSSAQVLTRAKSNGVGTTIMNFSRLRFPFTAVRAALALRRADVEVLNTHSSRDGYLMGLAARLAGTPLLIRSRHIDVDYPNPRISRHAFTTFADHVVTTSQKITDHLRSTFHLSAGRITTLPTGIDLSWFTPDGDRASLGDSEADYCVGMVSVLRSWKGHPVFIEAARLLRDRGVSCMFAIVGSGPQGGNIKKIVGEYGLSGKVVLTGHREDIPAVLRALDVLVIPSTGHEGIPQIGLQALACGTPVVGSDAGGIPEIIRHGETGRIVAAGDAELLANAIAEALTDTGATNRMADCGREMVEREHGIDNMLDQLEKIYADHLMHDGS